MLSPTPSKSPLKLKGNLRNRHSNVSRDVTADLDAQRITVESPRPGVVVVRMVQEGVRCEVETGSRGWWLVAPDLGIDASAHEAAVVPEARLLAAAIMAGIGHYGAGAPLEVRVDGIPAPIDRDAPLRVSITAIILAAFAARAGEDIEDPHVRTGVFELAGLVGGRRRSSSPSVAGLEKEPQRA